MNVAIGKDNSLNTAFSKGLEQIGGIHSIVEKNDDVFIKFNLAWCYGFPKRPNISLMKLLIEACETAGARKIFLGTFIDDDVPFYIVSEMLGLEKIIENLGAELVFLDKSDYLFKKKIKKDQLVELKKNSYTVRKYENRSYLIPNELLKAQKLIIVNQVSAHPIFTLDLSMFNYLTFIPKNPGGKSTDLQDRNHYCKNDGYKKSLLTTIFDIYSILPPHLVINDLFYLQEGAGPCIHEDSQLRKINLLVMGKNPLEVDFITLKLLDLDPRSHEIMMEAMNRGIFEANINEGSSINELIENFPIAFKLPVKNLSKIGTLNFYVKQGTLCSGCYLKAYQLLNLLKTKMNKDLKYIKKNWFMLGINPPSITSWDEKQDNFILFGDCAIKTTYSHKFRKISKKTRKGIKQIKNKKILELSGCPPVIPECFSVLIKYFKKSNMPLTTLYIEMLNAIGFFQARKKFREWEAL
ncbi:MAG: DUF362 domain-containing protein [Promethearchaeota archaeon]